MSFSSSRSSQQEPKNLVWIVALWMLVLESSNSFLCSAFQSVSVLRIHNYQQHPSSNLWFQNEAEPHQLHPSIRAITKEELRRDWVDRSMAYYSKVMREQRRRDLGQATEYQDAFTTMMAMRHYFALRKIKEGKTEHALVIYRKIIDEHLMNSCTLQAVSATTPSSSSSQPLADITATKDHCDHATLATTTLLLALALQRTGASPKKTRSVFLKFFRVIAASAGGGNALEECACSAKVMGAFALFEMKQGNALKSYQIAHLAWQLDPTVMQPLLHWKQFRDAAAVSSESSSSMKRQQRRLVFSKPNPEVPPTSSPEKY